MFAHAYIDKYNHQTLNVFISETIYLICVVFPKVQTVEFYTLEVCVGWLFCLPCQIICVCVYVARILGNQILSLILWRDYCTILWHSFKLENLHLVLNTLTHKILNISPWWSLYLSLIVWSCDWCIQKSICFELPYMYLLDFEKEPRVLSVSLGNYQAFISSNTVWAVLLVCFAAVLKHLKH